MSATELGDMRNNGRGVPLPHILRSELTIPRTWDMWLPNRGKDCAKTPVPSSCPLSVGEGHVPPVQVALPPRPSRSLDFSPARRMM